MATQLFLATRGIVGEPGDLLQPQSPLARGVTQPHSFKG